MPLVFNAGLIAIADGPELLVYQEGDGAPVWKQFCDGILIGIAITGQRLITLDSEGQVTWWRLMDGQREDTADMGTGVSQLVVSPDGAVAAVTPNGIQVAGGPALSLPQVSAAAYGPNGGSIGVGTHTGTFSAIDPTSGAAWGSVELGAAISGVGWSAQGNWVVAAANRIAVVSGDGAEVLASIAAPDAVRQVAVSENGLLVASICGTMQVAAFELHGNRAIGTVDLKREIEGVGFGSAAMLAIGVDDGDVSLIDLFTGKVGRTEPHPGRGRNTWAVHVNIDRAAVRGAVALNKAGGDPIAKYVPIPDDDDKGGCFLGCGAAFLISTLMCTGCASCSGIAWYFELF